MAQLSLLTKKKKRNFIIFVFFLFIHFVLNKKKIEEKLNVKNI